MGKFICVWGIKWACEECGIRANGATGSALFLRNLRSGTRWRICSRRCKVHRHPLRRRCEMHEQLTAAGPSISRRGSLASAFFLYYSAGGRGNGDKGVWEVGLRGGTGGV